MRLCCGHDGLGGEAELAEQRRRVGRGAEVVEGDDAAGVADEVAPGQSRPGLDATRALTVGGSTSSR